VILEVKDDLNTEQGILNLSARQARKEEVNSEGRTVRCKYAAAEEQGSEK